MAYMKKGYYVLDKIQGPMIIVSNTEGVSYDEMVDVIVDEKQKRKGKVVKIDGDRI